MDPFATLNDEHRLIERVISALLSYASRIDHGADPADLGRFVGSLISGFADARHHGKEEDILFEAMIAAGFPTRRRADRDDALRARAGPGIRGGAARCRGPRGRVDSGGSRAPQGRRRGLRGNPATAHREGGHGPLSDGPPRPPAGGDHADGARFDELEGGEDAQAGLEAFLGTADALFTRYLGTPALSVRPLSVRAVASVHHS